MTTNITIRMTEDFIVSLPVSSIDADMAGMPAEWLERAVRAVGRPTGQPAYTPAQAPAAPSQEAVLTPENSEWIAYAGPVSKTDLELQQVMDKLIFAHGLVEHLRKLCAPSTPRREWKDNE